MRYEIQTITHSSCPFKEGHLLTPEEESQYHLELGDPVRTVTEVSEGIELAVGQQLSESEYRDRFLNEKAFEVSSLSNDLYRVAEVSHSECPLKPGELIEQDNYDSLKDKFGGFTAERLKYRITSVYHPDCKLETDTLLTENEKKAVLKEFLDLKLTLLRTRVLLR